MGTYLRVLILEDWPDDAELMVHELRAAGFEPEWQRVDGEEDYVAHLDPTLDVILADYTLPQFNALRALHLLQERDLDIPFIVVSGSVREEVVVECVKKGATDYLLKDRLARLGGAVTRALEERQLRQEKRLAESALQERIRQTRELQRFVSPPTVELIRELGQVKFGVGELHDFAVLFTDMRRFTDMADKLSPEASFRVLSHSLKLQVEAVLRFKGHVDKIYGDGFLAYFEGEDRVERTLRCALHIRALIQEMEVEREVPVLPVGLAVNVGPVLFGLLGTDERMDHTLVGDVVNVCARLCGHARPFQIVVTEKVRQLASGALGFRFYPLGDVSLKGKPEPLPIYEVRASKDEPTGLPSPALAPSSPQSA